MLVSQKIKFLGLCALTAGLAMACSKQSIDVDAFSKSNAIEASTEAVTEAVENVQEDVSQNIEDAEEALKDKKKKMEEAAQDMVPVNHNPE